MSVKYPVYPIPKSLTYYSRFHIPFLIIPYLALHVPEKLNCSPLLLNPYRLPLCLCAFVHILLSFNPSQFLMFTYLNSTHYLKPNPNVTSMKKTFLTAPPEIFLSSMEPKSISSESLLWCLTYSLLLHLFTHMPSLLQVCVQYRTKVQSIVTKCHVQETCSLTNNVLTFRKAVL